MVQWLMRCVCVGGGGGAPRRQSYLRDLEEKWCYLMVLSYNSEICAKIVFLNLFFFFYTGVESIPSHSDFCYICSSLRNTSLLLLKYYTQLLCLITMLVRLRKPKYQL